MNYPSQENRDIGSNDFIQDVVLEVQNQNEQLEKEKNSKVLAFFFSVSTSVFFFFFCFYFCFFFLAISIVSFFVSAKPSHAATPEVSSVRSNISVQPNPR